VIAGGPGGSGVAPEQLFRTAVVTEQRWRRARPARYGIRGRVGWRQTMGGPTADQLCRVGYGFGQRATDGWAAAATAAATGHCSQGKTSSFVTGYINLLLLLIPCCYRLVAFKL